MTQGLHSTISATDVFGQSSTTDGALIRDSYANATVPNFEKGVSAHSSTMSIPFIQGGFTRLLQGVEQVATLSSSARKLHFD